MARTRRTARKAQSASRRTPTSGRGRKAASRPTGNAGALARQRELLVRAYDGATFTERIELERLGGVLGEAVLMGNAREAARVRKLLVALRERLSKSRPTLDSGESTGNIVIPPSARRNTLRATGAKSGSADDCLKRCLCSDGNDPDPGGDGGTQEPICIWLDNHFASSGGFVAAPPATTPRGGLVGWGAIAGAPVVLANTNQGDVRGELAITFQGTAPADGLWELTLSSETILSVWAHYVLTGDVTTPGIDSSIEMRAFVELEVGGTAVAVPASTWNLLDDRVTGTDTRHGGPIDIDLTLPSGMLFSARRTETIRYRVRVVVDTWSSNSGVASIDFRAAGLQVNDVRIARICN